MWSLVWRSGSDPLIAAESSTFSNFAIAALSAAASSSRCSSRAASRARPFSDMGGRGDARDEAILQEGDQVNLQMKRTKLKTSLLYELFLKLVEGSTGRGVK